MMGSPFEYGQPRNKDPEDGISYKRVRTSVMQGPKAQRFASLAQEGWGSNLQVPSSLGGRDDFQDQTAERAISRVGVDRFACGSLSGGISATQCYHHNEMRHEREHAKQLARFGLLSYWC